MPTLRVAEYPRPDHVLLHLSDTHLIAGEERLYGAVDADTRLRRLLDRIEAARIIPSALVFTGDLVDAGEPAPTASCGRWSSRSRPGSGARSSGSWETTTTAWRCGSICSASPRPGTLDRVFMVEGLRIVALDTSVPGHHHGEVSDAQLAWLGQVLDVPAPFGTVLAMHHSPLPTVADLAVAVELVEQHRLESVLEGTDVRAILAGHLHYSSFGTFAGIPVSVGLVDLLHPGPGVRQAGTRGQDAAQAFSLVHVYPETVTHSVVPVESGPTAGEAVTARQARARLDRAGIVIPDAPHAPCQLDRAVSGARERR